MNKLKIFIYHLIVFVIGSVGLVAYVFYRMTSPSSGLGGVIVMPAVALVYVAVFGILCLISMIIWLLTSYFRNLGSGK